MALLGRVVGTALFIGAGALAVGAIIAAPRLLQVARPHMREALRRGFDIYDKARSAAAELVDDVEDLVAEVRAGAPVREARDETSESAIRRA